MKDFSLWAGIGKDCDMLKQSYDRDNYRVIDTGNHTGRCLICFSGNGLYFPNTQETFKKVIVDNDRFEWANLVKADKVQSCYQRIILVRDIYKQWYVTGINSRLNNVDKVVEILKELCIVEGGLLSISTCGNSAGGYAAVLFGSLLEAERIFNFSGQYNLNDEIYRGEKLVAPFLKEYKNEAGQYYNLIPILKKNEDKLAIYYFFPWRCDWDRREYESVKDLKCIKAFKFNNSNHGDTVWGGQEIDILASDTELLLRVHNSQSTFSKFSFAMQYHPVSWCIKRAFRNQKKQVKGLYKSITRRLHFK